MAVRSRFRWRTLLAALLLLVAACGREGVPKQVAEAEPAEWSYSGDTGPEHWGELEEEFSTCSAGEHQSPIDIAGAEPGNAAPIEFSYAQSPAAIVNSGHSIQVDFAEAGSIGVDDRRFDLVQLHFHRSSEHLLGGRRYPLEMHIVHRHGNGSLAVVGVLIDEGAANDAFEPIWSDLPRERGSERSLAGSVNPEDLLPVERAAYRYDGSLTTPPCTEGVRWIVLTETIEMSAEQITTFGEIYPANFRPVQPLGERTIAVG